jgi:hypothetical protein
VKRIGCAGPLVCAGAMFLTSVAAAAGEAPGTRLTVSLDYVVGSGCPDAAGFKAVVVARLGYDPFVDSAADRVVVRMGPHDHAIDGSIEWRDATGQWTGDQTFPSVATDCPSLARAMAFVLAVQIHLLANASAAAGRNAPAPPPPEPRPPPSAGTAGPVPEPPLATAAVSTPRAEPIVADATKSAGSGQPAFAIGVGPSVGFGMSSAPILLGQVFGSLAWQRVSVELAAAASLPATTRRADGAGFSQQHLLASVAACAVIARWNACALVNAGEIRMAGENIDRPVSATAALVEAGARIRFNQSLGDHAFLTAHADGVVNLIRWTATLDQVPVWTAPRFAAALGVDAGVRFP